MSRVGNLALIAVGGMAGTAARASLEAAAPVVVGQWPWTTFWINICGSLLLGVLLEVLAAGDDVGWRHAVRLGMGTGLLGGFTTYSAFSLETVGLLHAGAWSAGLGYPVASVLVGIASAVVAMVVVRKLRAPRQAT